jgi:hypothetical protein
VKYLRARACSTLLSGCFGFYFNVPRFAEVQCVSDDDCALLRPGEGLVIEPREGANGSTRSAMEPIAPIINAASLFRLLGIPY